MSAAKLAVILIWLVETLEGRVEKLIGSGSGGVLSNSTVRPPGTVEAYDVIRP
jgi:hypothetical protein